MYSIPLNYPPLRELVSREASGATIIEQAYTSPYHPLNCAISVIVLLILRDNLRPLRCHGIIGILLLFLAFAQVALLPLPNSRVT